MDFILPKPAVTTKSRTEVRGLKPIISDEAVEEHFRQHIYPSAERKEEFVEWARQQIAAMTN